MRTRTRPPREWRGRSRARRGWGCRCASTRSGSACRAPAARRWWPGRSAPSLRRSPGRASARRGWPASRRPASVPTPVPSALRRTYSRSVVQGGVRVNGLGHCRDPVEARYKGGAGPAPIGAAATRKAPPKTATAREPRHTNWKFPLAPGRLGAGRRDSAAECAAQVHAAPGTTTRRGKAPVHRSVPAALIATLLAAAVASAAPGTVDTTFGTSGKVTTSFGRTSADIYALVLQPDSKIVVAGWDGNLMAFALARYGTNGSLDTTFGTRGEVTTALGIDTYGASTVLLQPNGKVVEGGNICQAY